MKRFRDLTNRYPILSQVAAWLLLGAIAIALLPKDDGDSIARVQKHLEKCT